MINNTICQRSPVLAWKVCCVQHSREQKQRWGFSNLNEPSL